MPAPLLLSVKSATVRYTQTPVFEDLSFNIHSGSRIALIGKNGAGKTTLMKIITGQKELDEGERWEEADLTIGYLKQDIIPQENITVFDFIFAEIKEEEKELYAYKVDIVTQALQIDPQAFMSLLSGGQLRRAGLARALVEEPDILLLDEPTNHLDLEAIEWLEQYLMSYKGTLLCISHDKTFLSNITDKVFWLDRGRMRVSPRGFKYFEEWSSMLLEQEERELKNRKQLVAQEVEWASRGVKARRKRNMNRVEQMQIMREKLKADEASFRRATAKIELKTVKNIDQNSKIVAEFHNVYKSFNNNDIELPILRKFSFRIQRGDRIGILGKNGSGKTTFLRLLVGEIKPDQGHVKKRKELEFSYFDQKRSALNPFHSLKKVLTSSEGDYVDVMGKKRHVCGYLKDFMFDPSRADDHVSMLSGGQKNRLMLAKVLANPKSCLILDEPTNDLDMDTLDMLEEILSNYKGTLIIVSHDRDFLDQTVTKILAFEGDGKVETCIGGYSDYLMMKKKKTKSPSTTTIQTEEKTEKNTQKQNVESKNTDKSSGVNKQKLSYKLKRELEQLPLKIAQLEQDIQLYTEKLSETGFYEKNPHLFHDISKKLSETQNKLERYENRWLELSEL